MNNANKLDQRHFYKLDVWKDLCGQNGDRQGNTFRRMRMNVRRNMGRQGERPKVKFKLFLKFFP